MVVVTVTSAAAAAEESLSKRFWNKLMKETMFASYSPFFVCLAAGNLEVDVFRGFIAQDVFFHKAFVQAYDVAENFSDDDDDKSVIAELRNGILNRQETHKSIIEEWGVDHTKVITPYHATVKFTELLQATAAGKVDGGKVPSKILTPFEKTKIVAYLVSTMTSYMRLYSFMIKQLQNCLQYEDGNHSYKKWVDDISSSAFETRTHENEELLDRLCISLTEEELKVVEKLYSQAMKLAIAFFIAQPAVQETVAPLVRWHDPLKRRFVMCLDFDSTCTVINSSAILLEIAIQTAKKAPLSDADLENEKRPSVDLRKTWNDISTLYNEEYEQCIRSILSAEKVEGFNYESLCNALELLSDFKKQADSRVVESGVLKGLSFDDIKRPGESMILQNDCPDFLRKIANKEDLNADMHAFSYCWCGDLIRAAFSAGGLSMLKVHSNELDFKDSSSTGEMIRKIQSPLDKITVFKTILKNLNSDDSISADQQHLSVYIGDSVSDLLCLLYSDVGIVIGTNTSLKEVGTHFGISFVPLFPELAKKQRQLINDGDEGAPIWKGLSGVLYTVSSWTEIHAFILGT